MSVAIDTAILADYMNDLLGALGTPLGIFIGVAIAGRVLYIIRNLF